MTTKTSLSIAEFERLPDDDLRHELDEGELLTEPPAGEQHGSVSAEVLVVLGNFVKEHGLGKVRVNLGSVLGEETVRATEATFIRTERVVNWPLNTFGTSMAVRWSPKDQSCCLQVNARLPQYIRCTVHGTACNDGTRFASPRLSDMITT